MFVAPWPNDLRALLTRSPSLRAEILDRWTDGEVEQLLADWNLSARAEQLPPAGQWRVWLLLAGRGFGKTRAGAEWVRHGVECGRLKRVALIAPTAADARDVMIEGESGLLSIAPRWSRPIYEPSKRRLTWPNGAVATSYSADVPERLRGPQHDALWADELAAWRYPEAWDMAMFGLRLGKDPRALVTTTPKPVPLVRELLARAGRDVAVTRGSTFDNAANLAPGFIETIVAKYEGTRLGRQELHAELLDDTPGALWRRDRIEELRVAKAPELKRIVVAIDPAVSSGENSDETGIVVAGLGIDDHAYVLEDKSGRHAPEAWADIAVSLYRLIEADRIVGEVNQGGDLVERMIRAIEPSVAYRKVRASRGKAVRAEPVSALYEKGRVHHVGAFPALEDQMCAFAAGDERRARGFSPDRVDALVWAITELMLGPSDAGLLEYWQAAARKEAD